MEETFEQWQEKVSKMNHEDFSNEIKNKILLSNDMDDKSKKIFQDCYEYVIDLYKRNKPLDTNLLYIHLTEVKGYKGLQLEEFVRFILLLNLCGFGIQEY